MPTFPPRLSPEERARAISDELRRLLPAYKQLAVEQMRRAMKERDVEQAQLNVYIDRIRTLQSRREALENELHSLRQRLREQRGR
jgi:chromosome segregation ATPase